MLPISNRGLGMNIGFPDVCMTPAVPSPLPIPYPNIAMNAQAAPFVLKVMVLMMNVLNMGSKIPMTSGDEAGVAHPLFKQMGAYTMGNPKVLMSFLPAITFAMPTTGNMMNNPLGLVAVPSVVHVFLSLRDTDAESHVPAPICRSAATLASLTKRSGLQANEVEAGIWLLEIPRMGRDLPARMHALVKDMPTAPRGWVIDLRGNPGGEVSAALELAGDFLPQDAEVARLVDADGDETVYRTRHPVAYSQPLVLLVDNNTASAAELFAASLQAAGRARVVGQRSYGKTSVESVAGAADAEHVYYAECARWRVTGRTAGTSNNGAIVPDVPCAPSEQLQTALATLRTTKNRRTT